MSPYSRRLVQTIIDEDVTGPKTLRAKFGTGTSGQGEMGGVFWEGPQHSLYLGTMSTRSNRGNN